MQSLNRRIKKGLKSVVMTLSLQKYQVTGQIHPMKVSITPVASKRLHWFKASHGICILTSYNKYLVFTVLQNAWTLRTRLKALRLLSLLKFYWFQRTLRHKGETHVWIWALGSYYSLAPTIPFIMKWNIRKCYIEWRTRKIEKEITCMHFVWGFCLLGFLNKNKTRVS